MRVILLIYVDELSIALRHPYWYLRLNPANTYQVSGVATAEANRVVNEYIVDLDNFQQLTMPYAKTLMVNLAESSHDAPLVALISRAMGNFGSSGRNFKF